MTDLRELGEREEAWFKAHLSELPRMSKREREGTFPVVFANPIGDATGDVFGSFAALDLIDGEPWLVKGDLASVDGVALTQALTIWRWRGGSGSEVTGTVLRSVRVALIRDRALQGLRRADVAVDSYRTLLGLSALDERERELIRRAAASARREGLKRGRTGYPDDHYRGVALRYLELVDEGYGRQPGKGIRSRLARDYDRPPETVRDWIRRARELGFLEGGGPGRLDVRPGPNLRPREELGNG
jgi:hypothetical protein